MLLYTLPEGIIQKILKFGVVGLIGMIIDFLVTWILRDKLKWNQFVANTIGIILAATSNFILNKYWTFHNQSSAIARQYSSFMVISLIGLALNNLIIYLLNRQFKWNFYFCKACAIVLVMIWNFTMNYLFSFA